MSSQRQTFDELVVHTPYRTARWRLPWPFSTFDYRELCALMCGAGRATETEFETATVTGRKRTTPSTPTAAICGAADRRRARLAARAVQRAADPAAQRRALAGPGGPSARAAARTWSSGSTPATSAPATAWSFPAGDELRVGVGLVLARASRQGADCPARPQPRRRARAATRATGSLTSCDAPTRTASSSRATPPGTACR